ncbi:MAG: ATP-binding protein [Paludibacteraceae bacterium]|nr:ATP-binding protein [Paludibacteraceae bacterium]
MLYRKIESYIEEHLKSDSDKILLLEGARQIGKSYIIREVAKRLYVNFVELNFVEDEEGVKLFKEVHTTNDFYMSLSMLAGEKLDKYENTLVFLDEIQQYPQYLTMLKFFRQERRYRFIASGSLLGVSLRSTTSIPVGSIIRKEMFQLDFEEFIIANGFGLEAVARIKEKFRNRESLSESQHNMMMDLFRRYLIVGGMPDVVNTYLETHNVVKVRELQNSVKGLYADDASKYENNNGKNLLIKRIYDMIPSQMENKKKRIVFKDVRDKKGERFDKFQEEFEYLISSGISNAVHAISNLHFPLFESVQKNLLKLYLNDVGLLTSQLYGRNAKPILEDERSINLGSVYESVVAQELKAHGYKLFYYDNRNKGEVDFIIDDYNNSSILPIEVKSGRDYTIHSALNKLTSDEEYNVKSALVLSNEREVKQNGKIVYLPIYYVMFIDVQDNEELLEF